MPRAERFAVPGLLVAMAVSAVATLIWSGDLTFWQDELTWLVHGPGYGLETLVTPHNGHLLTTTRVIYEGLPPLTGDDYLPFRLILTGSVLAIAAFVFVLVRRRVGGLLALGCACVLLFFGTAPDQVVSPVGIGFALSLAFALGAMVAFDADRRNMDVLGCVLLVLATLSFTIGFLISFAVAVWFVATRENRHRAWAPLIPVVLWGVWWIWALKFDQGVFEADNIIGLPAYVLAASRSAIAAISGLGPAVEFGSDGFRTAAKVFFSIVALGAAALLITRVRRYGLAPMLGAFLLIAFTFWIVTGLADAPDRRATTPRYVYFGAIGVMLITAEALRHSVPDRRVLAGLAAVLVLGTVLNFVRMVGGVSDLEEQAEETRVQLAMVELAGPNAVPTVSPASLGPPGSEKINVPAELLAGHAEEYGLGSASLAEVEAASARLRNGADFVLGRSLFLAALAAPADAEPVSGSCRNSGGDFELEPGASLIRSDAEGPLLLGRFGDAPTLDVGALVAEGNFIAIPDDGYERPWAATAPGPVEVCELSPDGGLGG